MNIKNMLNFLSLIFLFLVLHPFCSLAQSHIAYTISRVSQEPVRTSNTPHYTNMQGKELNYIQDNSVEVEITRRGEVEGTENLNCELIYHYGKEEKTLAKWIDRSCEYYHFGAGDTPFFLPSGNIVDVHNEIRDLVFTERTRDGTIVFQQRFPESYIRPEEVHLRVSDDGHTVAFSFIDLHSPVNGVIAVYKGGKIKSFEYRGEVHLTNLKNWNEMMFTYRRKPDISYIASTVNGKILKKYNFEVYDFNKRHEVVGNSDAHNGIVIKSKKGEMFFSECNVPNSARLKNFSFNIAFNSSPQAIDARGRVFGEATDIDTEKDVKYMLTPSTSGIDGLTDYCATMEMELSGICTKYLDDLDAFELPDSMPCQARVTLSDATGKPLAGLNVAVIEEATPGIASVLQRTDKDGKALLNFNLTARIQGVSIVGPFLDDNYYSDERRVLRYNEGSQP
jgi:hypothetical protein